MLRRLVVDADACAGCRVCELACSGRRAGVYQPSASRVTVLKEDAEGFDYPVMCHQCGHCPALEACPAGALSEAPAGVVVLDEEACTRCGACVRACRHQAIRMGAPGPLLCDLCGGDPACVRRCPTGALAYAEAPEPEPVGAVKAAQRERWRL